MLFVIIKKLLAFSSFLVQVVCKSFFSFFDFKYFKKLS